MRSAPRRRREAFTMVEMMVVIAIIAVLATLTIGATMRVMQSQRESNTQTVLQTIDKALQQQWAKIIADAKKETPSPTAYSLANGDRDRAQVMWIKFRLMEAFPVSYLECFNQGANNPLYNNLNVGVTALAPPIPFGMRKNIASYSNVLKGASSPKGVPFAWPNSESAACLLMALSVNRGGGAFLSPDALGGNAVDADGDGIKEIVDGWGIPFFFYRFPTPTNWPANDLQNSNPNTSSNYADPVDPLGTLLNATWFASANRQVFEQLCHPIVFGPNTAFYITPVVASAGASGMYTQLGSNFTVLGLGLVGNQTAVNAANSPAAPPAYATPPSLSISNQNDANDNIYNFFLRLGGTGN